MMRAFPTLARRAAPARRLASSMAHTVESFASGTNAVYVEQMYAQWKEDPSSVHVSWSSYFSNVDAGVGAGLAFVPPPDVAPYAASAGTAAAAAAASAGAPGTASDNLGLSYLIRAYQVRGHEAANLDPLGLHQFQPAEPPPELDPAFHGFTAADLDRPMVITKGSSGGYTGFLDSLSEQPNVTLKQVLDTLKETYCGPLGVEYMHISSRAKCNWLRDRIEHPSWQRYTKEKKLHILERLSFAENFEGFLALKFNSVKRFGLDGGESVIPGLKAMIDRGSELGIKSFQFGMPHRGRLNVLANVLRKEMPLIFNEFRGTHYDMEEYMEHHNKLADWSGAGDVKYHLGTSMDREYPDGRNVHLSLVANPSHLEAVNTVVLGKARARQFYAGNTPEDTGATMSVLLHGDAAFAGQGIVYETMQLAKVSNFDTGGTIHVIVNNQVGFTTDPVDSRSTTYCSDLGKAFNVPIFHCNGDDPLAVCTAFEMAVEWRQEFGEDCIIDMICYRRNGHNEIDQPLFTQPTLYAKIAKHPGVLAGYEKKLLDEMAVTAVDIEAVNKFVHETYEKDFEASKEWKPKASDWLSSKWADFKGPRQQSRIRPTGTDMDVLTRVGASLSTLPDDFTPHRIIKKLMGDKRKMIESGAGIDWATGEALAWGTLLLEGNHVRITGQDVQRGTFSHRHCVLHDQSTNNLHTPLNTIAKHIDPAASLQELQAPDTQAKFIAQNSILSEFGVLGFELGYSLENPNSLVIWEAQFGDFVNGAQVIIDQFLAAGESKWTRQSGLVMLLPHGYDGQGAEHSSCRIERFLQSCDDDEDYVPEMAKDERMQIQHANWQIANCTTPANYFHLLRRQVHRDFRKPLIVAAPKNMLRLKGATSTLDEFGPGTEFQRVLLEDNEAVLSNAANVRRVVFCSGKIYYELIAEREKQGLDDVAIVRIEQISPFPFDRVAEQATTYPNAEFVWCQEEPKNMGCWAYVQPRIETATRDLNDHEIRPSYAGRGAEAAPATGMGRVHIVEQQALISDALAEKNLNPHGKSFITASE